MWVQRGVSCSNKQVLPLYLEAYVLPKPVLLGINGALTNAQVTIHPHTITNAEFYLCAYNKQAGQSPLQYREPCFPKRT